MLTQTMMMTKMKWNNKIKINWVVKIWVRAKLTMAIYLKVLWLGVKTSKVLTINCRATCQSINMNY